ncbi:MAG: hypothetical protein AAFP19_14515 [Bacteroidota bacterium]
MTESKEKKAPFLQTIVLTMMIVVLPLGSWYYLQMGFNYYKDAMSELHEYGPLPNFALLNQMGDTIQEEQLKGKVAVISFVPSEAAARKKQLEITSALFDQFDVRDDIIFLLHESKDYALSADQLIREARENQLSDSEQLFWLSTDQSTMLDLLGNGYKMPNMAAQREKGSPYPLQADPDPQPGNYPYIILVDTNLMIRNYYDYRDDQSVKRLIEHLALIMPRREAKNPAAARSVENN